MSNSHMKAEEAAPRGGGHTWTMTEPIIWHMASGQPYLYGGITPGGLVRVLALDASALEQGRRAYGGSSGVHPPQWYDAGDLRLRGSLTYAEALLAGRGDDEEADEPC